MLRLHHSAAETTWLGMDQSARESFASLRLASTLFEAELFYLMEGRKNRKRNTCIQKPSSYGELSCGFSCALHSGKPDNPTEGIT
jgi:hypothetical protein